ncbi:hypothetical protein QQ020_00815 [Fulvivirgaceae bacterium BMA12]|uniref:Uncharacterized protein n=1 Tax=Agaribacillus aureus TaxID=3051825 RepID=A0ABT8KZV7_9BACT|nr:hypothetical protein [Fulvivirgaceae bacterium BMA12]
MKTNTNENQEIAFINQSAYEATIQNRYQHDVTCPDIFIDIKTEYFPKEKENHTYTATPKKRLQLAKRLRRKINNTYGGKMHLVQSIDQWIKLVSLNTEAESRAANQEYTDLLFFLFTFKEMLQTSNSDQKLIEKSLVLIYGLFDRKYLIKDLDKWIRFVALCTEKENYTGSEEYLGLLSFFFVFKDVLRNK